MKINHSISLVVPVLNEEEVIKETLEVFQKKLSNLFKNHEIIVVDDGSTDNTPKILRLLKKNTKNLRVLSYKNNMGVGYALISGFKKAKYEWVMNNSADRPFDIDDLKKAKSFFKDSDIIVAVRKDRSANPWFRKFTSKTSFYLVRFLFGVPIDDFHFIYIYKKKVVNSIKVTSYDTFAPAELLVKSYKKGYKISQFQAVFHKRTAGKSKYNNPLRYILYLKELLKFRIKLFYE